MSLNGRRERGVGLIEVLVAVLIFALGVLGMASLQVNAKRASYDALQRSIAVNLAKDIIERMRSNPSPDALAEFATVNNLGGGSSGSEPTPNCTSADCTHLELARHDIWEWEKALDGAAEVSPDGNMAGGLVTPRACIDYDAGVITVAIAWQGYQDQPPTTGHDCGTGLGLYGTDDKQRQLVVIQTFIEEV